MAWYNKYRPLQFSDVIGHDLVKSVLQNALEKNRIKHAYLFYGPKGVGKTTLARIFATSLNSQTQNQEVSIDTIEMDAASNTGIDDIRQLIESAKTPPLIGKYKIYIIDEVHMLSKAAMNALLKILEEPPVYLVFLLATTNPEKLIPTILSRLTKLNLGSHSQNDIVQNLSKITKQEEINIDENSLKLIARQSSGSLRDAINILETLASYEMTNYDVETTSGLLGLLPEQLLTNLGQSLLHSGIADSAQISKLQAGGIDGETFLGQFLEFLLSRSFEGDKSFDSLVFPVAEVLNLKLPLSSTVSALALLQVKISQQTQSNQSFNLKKNSTPEVSKPTPATKFINSEPSHSFYEAEDVQNDIKPIYEPETVFKSDSQDTKTVVKIVDDILDTDYKTENAELTLEVITKIFNQIITSSTLPIPLKMMTGDINVESINTSKVVLSVSSGMFQGQLNSPKLKEWLSAKLFANSANPLEIEVQIRENNKPIKVYQEKQNLDQVTAQEPQASDFQPENLPEPEHTPTADITTPLVMPEKLESKVSAGVVFYEVYNQLPPNADPKVLKVFKSPIPKPEQSTDWDEHADQLFEFED